MDRDGETIAVGGLAVELDALAVGEHVDREDDGAHAREAGAAVLHCGPETRVSVVVLDLGDGRLVAVRGKDHRLFAVSPDGAVEVARDEDAGGGFEGDVFHGVAVMRAGGRG